ncbi:hypothetical protein ACOSQ2_031890 [Xanthoceras sorbifolium]
MQLVPPAFTTQHDSLPQAATSVQHIAPALSQSYESVGSGSASPQPPEEFRGVFPVCIGGFLGKAKKLDEKISNVQLPKLAPQFDGLNCLETFVAH